MSALDSIGSAIDAVKKLQQAARKLKDAETLNLVGDLSIDLANLKMEIAELKEENLALKGKLKAAAAKPDLRSSLEMRSDGFYYFTIDPPPGRVAGPYCPSCFDAQDKLIVIHEAKGNDSLFGSHHCPACNNFYGE